MLPAGICVRPVGCCLPLRPGRSQTCQPLRIPPSMLLYSLLVADTALRKGLLVPALAEDLPNPRQGWRRECLRDGHWFRLFPEQHAARAVSPQISSESQIGPWHCGQAKSQESPPERQCSPGGRHSCPRPQPHGSPHIGAFAPSRRQIPPADTPLPPAPQSSPPPTPHPPLPTPS